jgi:hypothetical protein
MNHSHHSNKYYEQVVLFVVMFLVALFVNPMNILAYKLDDLYLSTTLVLTSLYMASTMIWAHQVFHYVYKGHFNRKIFGIGLLFSFFFIFLLRSQILVSPKQWLRRMIPHHSTALTTSTQLLKNGHVDDKTYRLAKDIVLTQQMEIDTMKILLNDTP